MSSCPDAGHRWYAGLLLACFIAAACAAPYAAAQTPAKAEPYPSIGRAATPKEITAWDIDVRPDFKGLPKGVGSVAKGMDVWEAKCASCHGVFGESNEVFSPIVGGTTADDVKTGHAARLNDRGFPGRTTLMKVATVSTLWDYINRAMPWNQPKSLTTEEVYAVTAYILNLGGVVDDNFVLSDQNIAQVQERMPNRKGMTTSHALWPGPLPGKQSPDVRATACMRDCQPAAGKVASELPEHARNAHGNLAQQNRTVGAQLGADTSRAAGAAPARPQAPAPATPAAAGGQDSASATAAWALAQKYTCVACHGVDSKIVGPGLREIAKKYQGQADGVAYLSGKIKAGGTGVWGAIPMPPQDMPEADAAALAKWIAAGAPR